MIVRAVTNSKIYIILVVMCIAVSGLAFLIRPHDCKPTYGPAPFYYNTDLTLWINLADMPLENLKGNILANRPVFAYTGWLFAQPVRLVLGDRKISSDTRASGTVSIQLATIAGLFLANIFAFILTSFLLYLFTERLTGDKSVSLLSALLWVTSAYAFAWSYHPVNEMSGLVLIFAFPLFLFSLQKNSSPWKHLAVCFGFGVLLLVKAYYVIPFVYLAWGTLNRHSTQVLIAGMTLFFLPTFFWRQSYQWITGVPFVDYHLGEADLVGTLSAKLLTINGLQVTFQQTLENLADFPTVLFNAGGIVVTISAIIFYSTSN